MLKVGGFYMAISYGTPSSRLVHFNRKHLGMVVENFPIEFGIAGAKFKKHYVYLGKKQADADEKCEKYWAEVEQGILLEIQEEQEYFSLCEYLMTFYSKLKTVNGPWHRKVPE